LESPEAKEEVEPPAKLNVPAPKLGVSEPVLVLASGGTELKFHCVKVWPNKATELIRNSKITHIPNIDLDGFMRFCI
jgi:hypothetical protein